MMDAGLEKIKDAKALSFDEEAQRNFRKMTPTSKKQFMWWLESAKREETRNKRITITVKLAKQNKTLSDYYYRR